MLEDKYPWFFFVITNDISTLYLSFSSLLSYIYMYETVE